LPCCEGAISARQKPTSGQSLTTSCDGAPPPPAQPTPGTQNAPKAPPPQDPFQRCSDINALLQNAAAWLVFDAAPPETLDSTHPDGFVDMGKVSGSIGGHHIWARPKEFAQFVTYVLDAVPNTQGSANSSKGLCLSLQ
jgi:hypothetical protein